VAKKWKAIVMSVVVVRLMTTIVAPLKNANTVAIVAFVVRLFAVIMTMTTMIPNVLLVGLRLFCY
jgi:hypothetical protein